MSLTSIKKPPKYFSSSTVFCERSQSPWHKDAFPYPLSEAAPEQGKRGSGWMEIDHCGNAIGWIPDGTDCEVITPEENYRNALEAKNLYNAELIKGRFGDVNE